MRSFVEDSYHLHSKYCGMWYETLPAIIGKKKSKGDEEEGELCSICYDEYQADQTIGTLKCKHSYHGGCIKTWLSRKKLASITSLKCVLTQEHLNAICAKYFVPEEVHPQLPSPDATMHERPTEMDLNAFIRTADPRKVRIVERARAKNERPIVTVAQHRTVTLLPTSVVRSFGELSASVEREFVGDASVGDGGDQGFDSVAGQDNVEPTVPVTEPVEAEFPRPKRSKKKRVTYDSKGLPVASHPPKRLRVDYGTTGAKSVDPEVDSLVRSAAPVMTEATTVATVATTVAISADVSKDKRGQEKRKWRSLAEEKNILLEAKDKEIENLKSQLLKAKEESAEVTQLRAQVSGLEATENSLRGEVASSKDHNILLEQECNSLKLKVTGLESTIAEKDHELSDLGASSFLYSLKSPRNQSLVHELEISSADLHEKLEMYEGRLKQLEEFQDNLMGPLRTRERTAGGPSREGFTMGKRGRLAFQQKDASTWDVMDLFDRVRHWSQAMSVCFGFAVGRVGEKWKGSLILNDSPFLKDDLCPIDEPLYPKALIEPPAEVSATNVLSTMVINATLGSKSEGKIDVSARGDLTFSQLDDEARDAVL
ncbi:gypsy type transposase [Tanacetum coccineum]